MCYRRGAGLRAVPCDECPPGAAGAVVGAVLHDARPGVRGHAVRAPPRRPLGAHHPPRAGQLVQTDGAALRHLPRLVLHQSSDRNSG